MAKGMELDIVSNGSSPSIVGDQRDLPRPVADDHKGLSHGSITNLKRGAIPALPLLNSPNHVVARRVEF